MSLEEEVNEIEIEKWKFLLNARDKDGCFVPKSNWKKCVKRMVKIQKAHNEELLRNLEECMARYRTKPKKTFTKL
jgi:5S rRNA maturation endonuclease (ribonuclease M5)